MRRVCVKCLLWVQCVIHPVPDLDMNMGIRHSGTTCGGVKYSILKNSWDALGGYVSTTVGSISVPATDIDSSIRRDLRLEPGGCCFETLPHGLNGYTHLRKKGVKAILRDLDIQLIELLINPSIWC